MNADAIVVVACPGGLCAAGAIFVTNKRGEHLDEFI
jgi:hypothetical protein